MRCHSDSGALNETRGMGKEQVTFPQDCPNWALVRDLLTDLQEQLLTETINGQDAAIQIQVVYEACQSTQPLDERWVQRQPGRSGQARQGARKKLDQSYLWFGVLKFVKKVGTEEGEKFLFTTMPNIIELALRMEESMPPEGLCFSKQQRGGSTVLSRQCIASVLACSFLCLFPERVRDRSSKLNVINFTNFFKHLPQSSQIAKMRCFLHYFERTVEAGLERQGSITFHRQVAERSRLPTLEDLSRSKTALCSLVVRPHGLLEDVGSSAIQVDFANRSIGGGVLGRGRVQEEIRFSLCPELVAAMLFMETMEDNEAIMIQGFEQFSQHFGYAASLQFAGPFYDEAKHDSSGNLLNTLCAIDATSFRWGDRCRQYKDAYLSREIHKALIGFSQTDHARRHDSVDKEASSEFEEEFITASESLDDECVEAVSSEVDRMAEVLAKRLLSQGMVEAVRPSHGPEFEPSLALSLEEIEPLTLDEMSLLSASSSDNAPVGQNSSTPREDGAQGAQAAREDTHQSHGGNGERLSLPLVSPRPQNGSSEVLEVDYSEWLANFRRRSSQLSDLTSRRSSSSTKHSSEFSSDLEEIYETLVQVEKAQHGIIEEETYGAAVTEYATHFVTSLMSEGTSVAAQMLPGMKEFQQGKPPAGTLKPQVVRPAAVYFDRGNGSSDNHPPTQGDWRLPEPDVEDMSMLEEGDLSQNLSSDNTDTDITLALDQYVSSLVKTQLDIGISEAVLQIRQTQASNNDEHDNDDHIPDDVYRWFAEKIVQEVFAHVVDELYFQRFTNDSWRRSNIVMNREGVQQRLDLSDSESVSSTSSSGELHRDGQSSGATLKPEPVSSPYSSGELHRDGQNSDATLKPESVSSFSSSWEMNRDGQNSGASFRSIDLQSGGYQEGVGVSMVHRGGSELWSGGAGVSGGASVSSSHPSKTSGQAAAPILNTEPITQRTKRKTHVRRTHSHSSDSESVEAKERKEERKSVTFTVDKKDRKEGRVSPQARQSTRSSKLSKPPPASRDGDRMPSPWFVMREIPVPFTTATIISRPLPGSGSTKDGGSSRSNRSSSGDPVSGESDSGAQCKDVVIIQREVKETSSSSAFMTKPPSSIPVPLSKLTESLSHAPTVPLVSPVPRPPSSSVCDSGEQSAESRVLPASELPCRDRASGAVPPSQSPSSPDKTVLVPSSSSAFKSTPGAGTPSVISSQQPPPVASAAEEEGGATSSLSEQDLNLDCYRAAAAIVSQVFQSLPDHLTEAELQSLQGNRSSFYYHGRKYESIFPRGSYETAAAVIGASEKGNVVSDSYMQGKAGATSSETTSPRRTRSQSPCFSWLSKRLSRETLTNAFVKVESRQSVNSYERRSSEPCQRSVTLSLQAFNTSRFGEIGDRLYDRLRRTACTDDDLDKVKAETSWRRGSLDSISMFRRRSSCGFKDPVLSRFAQELITADTSVPQLFLVGSGTNSSTTGSRRSSLSGFRDNTLATFESELLNSSFNLSQAPTSPRHKRPKRSHSRESRLWKSDSSDTEYWFPIPRRVGQEFQEQMERVHRHYSMDEIEDFADFVSTTVLQQAISIIYQDMEHLTPQQDDINIFSENFADQILREALVASAKLLSGTSTVDHRKKGKPRSVSDSEMDFSMSSNDLTTRSLEDRLNDFQDALDVSYSNVEVWAGVTADSIMSGVLQDLGTPSMASGGRPIATGNWGCGAFCGDPCLKVALQWMAASVAGCPCLLYFTFGDQRLLQLPAVVEKLSQEHWTVGQLMTAVRHYCASVLQEGGERGDGRDTEGTVRGTRESDALGAAREEWETLGSSRGERETLGRSTGPSDVLRGSRGERDALGGSRGTRDILGDSRGEALGGSRGGRETLGSSTGASDVLGSSREGNEALGNSRSERGKFGISTGELGADGDGAGGSGIVSGGRRGGEVSGAFEPTHTLLDFLLSHT